jgi:hypothetical protein
MSTAAVAPARVVSEARTAGTLNLAAALAWVSQPGVCAVGAPATAICHTRAGNADIPGLGAVLETYVYVVDKDTCSAGTIRVLQTTVTLRVAGKGDIHVVFDATDCLVEGNQIPASTQGFRVTGGTGRYAGASGSGTVTRQSGPPGPRVFGTDTLTGTLVAPATEFDLTPPTISGANPKTVRAPRGATRVRVVFAVSGTDDVDGRVAVSCAPRSGTRFRIGRTRVTCTATDASANETTARFTVTVRRR